MFHVILYQPEIPPNTGNIMRLCANTGTHLHLIGPLGFDIDDKKLRRAGMDYREWADVQIYDELEDCLEKIPDSRIFPCTTKAERWYSDVSYEAGDAFLFGSETSGLPEVVRARFDKSSWLRLPMQADSRSLNLSNAASIFVFEAWRQTGFSGGI